MINLDYYKNLVKEEHSAGRLQNELQDLVREFEKERAERTDPAPSAVLNGSEQYHTKCHDCGQFLKKEKWVSKNHQWKKHALCAGCLDSYDDQFC